MLEFQPSKPLTVGMELEFQLLNARSFELADGILPLLEDYPDSDNVQPEFIQETVEVVSDPCEDIAELEAHMRALVADVDEHAAGLGMRMCGAGTHPFSTRFAAITPKPRYLEIEDRSGYLSHTRITYATHVHIGVPDADEMVRLTGELVPYLPMLIALSANSPFWHGCQTGFASYRQRALAATGSYGNPPNFDDWADFQRFFKAAKNAGMCREVEDLHWDVRPQPGFGTVEVRTMDAVTTVSEAVALAALIRSLVAYLRETPAHERPPGLPRRLPDWAERENHFRASHEALGARRIADAHGELMRLDETTERLLEVLEPVAAGLGESRYLDGVRGTLAQGPGSARQLQVHEETGSLEQVVRAQVEQLRADLDRSMRARP
jgi:carboxylate-amine ligase